MVISAYGQNYSFEWPAGRLYMVAGPALASCSPCGGSDMSTLMSCLSWFCVQLGQFGCA